MLDEVKMLFSKKQKIILKVFLTPIVVYWLWGVLCIYVFQESEIPQTQFKLSSQASGNILTLIPRRFYPLRVDLTALLFQKMQ